MNILSVGIGGFLGAVSRYLLGKIPMHMVEGFPMNTFITNILGAVIIGVVFAATAKLGGSDSNMVLFLKTGSAVVSQHFQHSPLKECSLYRMDILECLQHMQCFLLASALLHALQVQQLEMPSRVEK